nr:CHAT domain-containing protein [Spirosoma liriopis]
MFCVNNAQAQCVSRAELLALLDSARSYSYAEQVPRLSVIVTTWKQCHYVRDSAYVTVLLDRAKAYFRTNDIQPAIGDLNEVVSLYKRKNPSLSRSDQIKAYYRLGFYWKTVNNFEDARKASEQAVKLNGDQPSSWASFASNTLAYVHYSVGEYQKALNYAEQGMYEARKAGDDVAYLENWCEKIKALVALGDDRKAAMEIDQAVRQTRTIPESDYYLALLLTHKANWENRNNHPQAAFADYKRAVDVNRKNKDQDGIANSCIDTGYFLYSQSDWVGALRYYQEALRVASDPYVRLRILDNIGAVYWQKKQYEVALTYYQSGLNAIPLRFSKRQVSALPDAQLVRAASQKEFILTLIQDKADTWLDYAKATANRQRLQHALDTYKVADQMIDFMRWEHTGQQSKLYWRHKTRGLYERAIETCLRLNNPDEAFRFLEKSRAVLLADKLNELGARQKLAPQLIAKEQQLRQAVVNQQLKLAGLPADDNGYLQARTTLLAKQDSLESFLKQLETSNPAYYQYKYDNAITSLPTLRQYLKKTQSSLITYFIGDSALYLMGVTADTAILRKQSIQDYNRAVGQFAQLLASPDAMNKRATVDRFLALSNSLYRQLLSPLSLPKGRVVILPDGFFVPFDALSRSANQPDYAVTDYAFSYAYSASLLLKNSHKQSTAPSFGTADFLGVAPVDFAPKLKQVALAGSDVAIKSIAERFRSPTLLTYKAATRHAFQQEVQRYPVVLLFTHANADSTDQEPTLYFADSTLRLSDLGDGALPNAQLVVLAACKTGIGANQQGEGVFSLARGFSALGVPSVLTTLWSVQNQATYQLTSLFHKQLDEGWPKDVALQRAKQEWLAQAEGMNQLPNYWAGLIIVGDTEPLSRVNYWLWGGVGLLVFLVGIGSWRYLRSRSIR